MPLPQGGAPGHPTPKRGRGNPPWADQPVGGLPTPHHWPPSHLPFRFKQVCNEPVITTLLEPLASSVSLTTGKPGLPGN